MADETDLRGLTPAEAREYVLAVYTSLKITRKQHSDAVVECQKWEQRVELAGQKGDQELTKAAQIRLDELRSRVAELEMEERELERQVDRLAVQLRELKHMPRSTIDADQLLAQLNMLVGEADPLEQELKDTEADAALEALKRRSGITKEGTGDL